MLKIIIALIVFSVIIMFHELGHFLLAKFNGVYVEEFALGLGPNLFARQIGETKYCIKALPFGGCCVMKGEDGEDMSSDSLNAKSPLQRFSIIFAGPFFNFILAFLLALILVGWSGIDPPVVGDVQKDSGAYEAGIRPGDKIVRLDHERIASFKEISLFNVFHNQDAEVNVTYIRDGERHTAQVVRKQDEETGYYYLGITSGEMQKVRNPLTLFYYSGLEVRYNIKLVVLSLKSLVMGRVSINEMAGPVGIVKTIGDSYDASIAYGVRIMLLTMISFAIMLSANLGVMNLLPLPALDGGRLVFIIVEMIRGKKIPPEKEGYVHLAGLVLLMTLMVLVMANDIRKIFMP